MLHGTLFVINVGVIYVQHHLLGRQVCYEIAQCRDFNERVSSTCHGDLDLFSDNIREKCASSIDFSSAVIRKF